MEAPKGDERAAEQAATLFAAPEVESQRINTEGGNKRKKRKIVIGVSFSFNFLSFLKETPPLSFLSENFHLYLLTRYSEIPFYDIIACIFLHMILQDF